MERLHTEGERATIRCQRCDRFVPLWDSMEQLFADDSLRKKVEALRSGELTSLDNRRLGKLLVHEVSARILSADQKCAEISAENDEGIDLTVEWTDAQGRGTGRYMYLQLKAGNSHLSRRASDGVEIFKIRKERWASYWMQTRQSGPVMLVVGTLGNADYHRSNQDKRTFTDVRWMEIGSLLRRKSKNGSRKVKSFVFKGERLDTRSVLRWRRKVNRAIQLAEVRSRRLGV